MKKPELLAPVGKMENAYAAVENGADAIYLGGKLFNARQSADNFFEDEIVEIINYCKLRGIKVYITVNTLVKDSEMNELFEYLKFLEHLRVSAIIIQDLAIVSLIKKYNLNLEYHASTQMSTHSVLDAEFLSSIGVSRAVLARELCIEEINKIRNTVNIEIETFIHGALCYSYSGQCLMSGFIGGRSGNRGKCAQPCRMKYDLYRNDAKVVNNLHILSMKDICTLEILPQLKDIDCFKIEGRMKSPEYVASVVKTYREYIDKIYSEDYMVQKEDVENLQSIFNRGGFCEKYSKSFFMMTPKIPKNIGLKVGKVVNYNFKTKQATIFLSKDLNPGDGIEILGNKNQLGTGISKHFPANSNATIYLSEPTNVGNEVYLSKNHTLLKELKKSYQKPTRKLDINATIEGKIGLPIEYTLKYKNIQVITKGEILQPALNQPISPQKVSAQVQKMGATPFNVAEFTMNWDENSYVDISSLNQLRRSACSELENKILELNEISQQQYSPIKKSNSNVEPTFSAMFQTLEQLEVILEYKQIKKLYFELNFNFDLLSELSSLCAGREIYIVLPYITRSKIWKLLQDKLLQYPSFGLLCRNMGQVLWGIRNNFTCDLDYNLNVMNSENLNFWYDLGINEITISQELSCKECNELKLPYQKIIYGYLPLMTTEQCLLKHYDLCKNTNQKDIYFIRDRKDTDWHIKTDCVSCNMQILSSFPLYIDYKLCKNSASFRMNFTSETSREIQNILDRIFYKNNIETSKEFFKLIE
ncbi:hypothetical protein AN639_10700 [Candidatus Epulonipiscium fishelsonii]|uniref:Uncharacterized protein n=1 Tax=Candidatus Epulonipiscium fishelsonii TaxID=77094 RepID=A0ACC8XFG5_9FIRM|nr:hypothetical protein AN396_00455 [Epulopiscium sp. SCG-B11WGA-EpuloA1]ONI43272.1 hypothetical protein AN639_10700 [Epulopiscium sp. SCG-B05WGA-EpuloA1]